MDGVRWGDENEIFLVGFSSEVGFDELWGRK